jgi:outer membrane protein
MRRISLVAMLSILLAGERAVAQMPTPAAKGPAAQPVPSGTTSSLTLQQAEAIAVRNNPQITIGKLRALVAQQFAREQRSALLPNAFLSLTAVDANPGSRIAAGFLNNPTVFPRAAGGVTVEQLITDFGRTTTLLSSSQYTAKAEDESAAATRLQIILAVDKAFYNSLETKALVKVAQETVNARQLVVDKIQALTNARLKSEIDLSFAKVDKARAELLLLEARNNYAASLASLSAILGYPDLQTFELVEENTEIAPPPIDVNPLISEAIQRRPEIAALKNEVESAQKSARAEHDLSRPTVSALGVVGQAPVRDDSISSWYGAVGVNVNIPVFNGFLYNARAKKADLDTSINRQRLLDFQNNMARDVRDAWQDSNRSFERLSVTRQLREQADLALDLAQSRYNLGLSSIIEFSQAELQKTEANIADTDAKYQYRLSEIVLAYTTGEPK